MEWSQILNDNLAKFTNKNLLSEFKKLSTNYDRVEFILASGSTDFSDFYNHQTKIQMEKSTQLSDQFRKQGNAYYTKKTENLKAFTCYTQALMHSPVDTSHQSFKCNKSLVLAYSNRSALFFEIGLYQMCLNDIQMTEVYFEALEPFVSDAEVMEVFNLIFKLMNRQKKCFFMLNKLDETNCKRFKEILLSNLFERIDEMRVEKLKEFETDFNECLERLKKECAVSGQQKNEENDCLTDQLVSETFDVVYSEQKGRHCLANRDIKSGECLFIERPYSAILLPEFVDSYCQTCFRHVLDKDLYKNYLNLEFCPTCVNVVFCSQKCREINKFHKFECGILQNLLHYLGVAHLAYRIVNSTEPEILSKYSMVQKTGHFKNVMEIDYAKSDADSGYEQVFYLMTHEAETHVEDLFKYSLTSILLGKYLLRSNSVMNQLSLTSLSSLILRHLLQTICNAHAITKIMDCQLSNGSSTIEREQTRYATAMYPRVSLLNHSCNSNVLSSFNENSNVIVVKSARDIKQTGEVFNCYGPNYLKMGFIERRQSLEEQYHFECKCDKCLEQLNNSVRNCDVAALKCFECQSIWTKIEIINGQINIRCETCKKLTPLKTYSTKFDGFYIQLNALDLNSNTDKARNLQILEDLLQKYQKYLVVCTQTNAVDYQFFKMNKINLGEVFKFFYMDYTKLIDALSRANCVLNAFVRASDLLEVNLKNLEFVYGGGCHVEFAHEYFKLAQVQCNCGQFKRASVNLNKAISIGENFYSNDNNIMKEFHELRTNILTVL